MRTSKNFEYALTTVLCLAVTGKSKPSADIAEWCGIPPAFLQKILQSLCKGGVTVSARGSNGGHRLRRRPEDITVLQVFQAVEGPFDIRPSGPAGKKTGAAAAADGFFEIYNSLAAGFFDGITVAQLAEQIHEVKPAA